MAELVESLPVEDIEAATRAARDRLGHDQIQQCSRICVYHHVNWVQIAATAGALVEAHGASLSEEAIDSAAGALATAERSFFASLFEDPINW